MGNDRRNFIKRAGGAAAAPLIAGSTTVGARESGDHDVIVIGGGFAGVTAARETSLRGLKTLLLEARPRLGGRTLTLPLAGHDLDLGGTWVGWSQPHVWAELMGYGIDIAESAGAGATRGVWMENGSRIEGDYGRFAEIFERAAAAFYRPAREAFPRPFDPLFAKNLEKLDAITAAQAIADLGLPDAEHGMAMALAAADGHSSPDRSSYLDQLRWMALGDFDVWNMLDNLARYRIKGGTKALIDRMHADGQAQTRLNTPIAGVTQSGGTVTVTAKSGEQFRARRVIIAIPLNCLNDISFEPGLSAVKQRVSKAGHTGSGTKVYARIRGREPLVMCSGTHNTPLSLLWTEYEDPDSQILVGFGPSKALLDIHSEAAVADAVQKFLPDAELLDFFTYDWNVDPYARGTWCMYPPNILTQDFTELQRAQGNVHFAGADIADGWRGFIDGAIESGLTIGRRVAATINAG